MSPNTLLLVSVFTFFAVFFGTLLRYLVKAIASATTLGKRATFETWAPGVGLDLTRSRVVPAQYQHRETWLAWEAFTMGYKLGIKTPREIRI